MISALFTVVAFQGDLSNLTRTEFQSKLGAARGSFGAAPTLGRKGEELEKDPYYYKIEMFSRAVFIFPAGVSTRRYLYRPGRSLALMENVGGKLRKVWHADVCTSATEPRIKGTGTLPKFIGLDDTFKKGKFSKSVQKSLDSVQAFALYNYQGRHESRRLHQARREHFDGLYRRVVPQLLGG